MAEVRRTFTGHWYLHVMQCHAGHNAPYSRRAKILHKVALFYPDIIPSPAQGYQKRKCWTACNYPRPEPAASAILSCISCYSPIALKTFNRKPSIQAFCNLALFRISFLADRWLFWGIFFLLSFPFSQSTLISPSCFRKGQ